MLGYLNYFDTETVVVAVGTGDGAVVGVALSAENQKRMNKNHAHKNSVCLSPGLIQDFLWVLVHKNYK